MKTELKKAATERSTIPPGINLNDLDQVCQLISVSREEFVANATNFIAEDCLSDVDLRTGIQQSIFAARGDEKPSPSPGRIRGQRPPLVEAALLIGKATHHKFMIEVDLNSDTILGLGALANRLGFTFDQAFDYWVHETEWGVQLHQFILDEIGGQHTKTEGGAK